MPLNKELILQAADLPRETVNVPEWGGEVLVRGLTARERDMFEQSLNVDGKTNIANIRARLCVLCMVDEAGNRLFSDDDAGALSTKSGAALNRVFEVAQRINGMGKTAAEDAEKN